MNKVVILDGARTPFTKLNGALATFTASDLGGFAIKEALQRSNVSPSEVEEVILGSVLQAGQGQIPSRQAATKANIPYEVPTETINKVCASGMRAITLGEQLIRLGDAKIVVAGGMESMTNAPYYFPKGRQGIKMGHTQLVDGMIFDGLTCAFHENQIHMGVYGDDTANAFALTREEQDEWAVKSHQKAFEAQNKLAQEIVPVEVVTRKSTHIVKEDESIRPHTSLEALASLRPAFTKEGTITAGNAPGVNDGACAVVLMNEAEAIRQNKNILASIIAHVAVATLPKDFPETPALAIRKLLEKTGKQLQDIDLFEVNEAFAAVALVSTKRLNIDGKKVNVNGGAVALGHPIGASGARIILTLAYELKRRGGGLGIAAICSGGGQGDAILIEVK